jgi:hypothetical protein
MRSAQKSNRSRGRGNRKGGGGNNINRVYDSAGPEGKVRGTPQQIIDKYLSLARDAQTSGDRVASENFLQHAEHYQRILITATAAQEQSRQNHSNSEQQPEAQPQPAAAGAAAPNGDATPAAPAEQPAEAAQPAGEIGGMAMIEPGEAPAGDLLVDAGAVEKAKPKRNGDGRRRPPKAAEAEDPTPPQETQPEA